MATLRDAIAKLYRISTGLLVTLCPLCARNGRETRVVREASTDWGCCPRCGWRWTPEKFHQKNKANAHVQ